MSIVNKRELTEILECDRSTVTTWQKKGLPIAADGTKGVENKYNTREVINWMIQREVNRVIGDGPIPEGGYLDSDQELARLRHHQANKVALEEQLLSGKLLDAEEVQLAMGKVDAEIRSAMLGLPSRMAPLLVKMRATREIRAALTDDVRSLLQGIADTADDETAD